MLLLKIKKIFIILSTLCLCMICISCKDNSIEIVIDNDKVDNCILAIAELEDVTDVNLLKNKDNILQAYDLYNDLNADEKEKVNNYSILDDLYNRLSEKLSKQKEVDDNAKGHFEEIKKDLKEKIGDYVISDIELPILYKYDDGDVTLSWKSSNPNIISQKGVVIPAYNGTNVTLSCKMYYQNVSNEFELEVYVPEAPFTILKSNKCIAYIYTTFLNSSKGLSAEEIKTIDVINMSFAYITENYSIDLTGMYSNLDRVLRYKQNGIRVMFSLRGGRSNDKLFSMACCDKQTRKKLIDNIVNAVIDYNFDGVDIDWEYPGFYYGDAWENKITLNDDRNNYTAFIQELYQALKSKNSKYLLTAAIPGGESCSRFDLKNIASFLDYVNVMTYDLNISTVATHHTALYSSNYASAINNGSAALKKFEEGGFKKENIILGAAFYGKKYIISNQNELKLGVKSEECTTILFSEIYNTYILNKKEGAELLYDEVAHAPYIIDTEARAIITYDSYDSIVDKCNYVLKNGYGGIMFWNYSEDNSGLLMKALYDGLKKK